MSRSQMWTGSIATLVIAIILGAYTALEPARMENAQARMEEIDILAASGLYAMYCAACHGADGDPRIGPIREGLPARLSILGIGIRCLEFLRVDHVVRERHRIETGLIGGLGERRQVGRRLEGE